MRGNVPEFELQSPRTLQDALTKLHDERGIWRPFAGGTDLMVLFEAGQLPPGKFLSLHQIRDLHGFHQTSDRLAIGAANSYSTLRTSKTIQREFPALIDACRVVGAIAIQNRGTLGGNIANASPAADSPPALLIYDALLKLVSATNERTVSYKDFHTGYKKLLLDPSELIHSILLPRRFKGWKHYYRKVGTRKAQAISKVVLAGCAEVKSKKILDIRIALGSVAPVPLRVVTVEQILRGQKISTGLIEEACMSLQSQIQPIDDIRSTANFRRKVAANLLREFLTGL